MNNEIVLLAKGGTFRCYDKHPAVIKFRTKSKTRPGIMTMCGWIRRGKSQNSIVIVPIAFETFDQIEKEYHFEREIFGNSIIKITNLKGF